MPRPRAPTANTTAGPSPSSDDDVRRAWWAVKEIPLPQNSFLAFDHQDARALEHEEGFLGVLAVVHRHLLAGFEHAEVDAEVGEPSLPFERAKRAEGSLVAPAGLACVHDKPALAVCDEAVLAHPKWGLGYHPSQFGTGVATLGNR